jgi:hypothetical protein
MADRQNAGIAVTVSASRVVPHAPERVYAFVARLDNHWRLSDPGLRLAAVDEQGGVIVIGGPFGLRRTARTTVTTAHEPHRFGGVARVGQRTSAHAQWRIEPDSDGTRVALESTIARTGALDRILLTLGGRWWLRRSFTRVLGRLALALE